MDLPFKLKINNKNLEFNNEDNKLIFKEYADLKILFTGDEDARLFIPTLIDNTKLDKKMTGIKPSDDLIVLYSNDRDDNQQVNPILPGNYLIEVKLNGEIFESYIEIIPKDLTKFEWASMVSEIEKAEINLSRSINRLGKYSSKRFYNPLLKEKPEEKIIEFISQIRNIVNQIKIKYTIKKNYKWVNPGIEKIVDSRTVRVNEINKNNKSLRYTAVREKDYSNNLNSFFKSILLDIYAISVKALNDLRISKQQILINESSNKSRIDDIDKNIKLIKQLNYEMYELINNEKLKNVNCNYSYINKGMIYDFRYNSIYKIYRKIVDINSYLNSSSLSKNYLKRTDKLYEIWIYITIINILIDSGYIPKSGWIFDGKKNSVFQEGTNVKLKSPDGEFYIRVVFNEKLLNQGQHKFISKTRPLLTASNRNKPDIRIDEFSNDDDYLGTTIIDAKYRKLSSILNDKNVRNQLNEYKNDPYNPRLRDLDDRLGAVKKVIALYASSAEYGNEGQNKNKLAKNDIIFMRLSPNFGRENLKDLINRIINEDIKYIKGRQDIFKNFN